MTQVLRIPAHPAADGMGAGVLDDARLDSVIDWWNAANYLSVGLTYLRDNVLLSEPLRAEHIKPRLLGHWGTCPGLNLVYAHLNRLILDYDIDAVYVAGPGHGAPAVLANVYLEGSYSEVYPDVTLDRAGLTRFFRQFSTPGGVPSHVSVPTPGAIHEGAELGYGLVHAFGAALDNPDLLVACVIGDGEAETGPLAAAWPSVRYLDPVHDGAVLPILHLNGYKLSGPTMFGRTADQQIAEFLSGNGYWPRFVEGSDVHEVHRDFANALESCYQQIHTLQRSARSHRPEADRRPSWPAIVLRTPKGWTGPKEWAGLPVEGTFRSHQLPLANVRTDPVALAELERWLRSYEPDRHWDADGRPRDHLAAAAPRGPKRMGVNPHANGGTLTIPLDLPPFENYAVPVAAPGEIRHENTRPLGELLRDTFRRTETTRNLILTCPDETASNRLGAVFEATDRRAPGPVEPSDDHVALDGRVFEVLSEHLCQGWLEGYLLTGRHGLFATYEAFAMVTASMVVQHANWLQHAATLPWRAPVPSLNILLTSTCWRNDHNGFSHQGPGLIDTVLSKKGTVSRVYLPPDANCLLSVADHCLRSRDYVNLIVIDKQEHAQYLDMTAAKEHCARGAGVWDWAGNGRQDEPDVVLAGAGDVMTSEALAAAQILRERVPTLNFRFVNVVDLMTLFPANDHPHGMSEGQFVDLFTADRHVVMTFHGYPPAVHQLLHGRTAPGRFHIRGFTEVGTTTTPFDMMVMNGVSRFHLVLEALRRTQREPDGATSLIAWCLGQLERHAAYIVEHLEDLPEIRDWTWGAPLAAAAVPGAADSARLR